MLVRAVFGLNKVDFRRIAKPDEYLYCARRQTFALSHLRRERSRHRCCERSCARAPASQSSFAHACRLVLSTEAPQADVALVAVVQHLVHSGGAAHNAGAAHSTV